MPGLDERSVEQPIADPIGRGLDQVGAVTEQAVRAMGGQIGTELGAVPPAAPDAPPAAVAVRVGAAIPELTDPGQPSAVHEAPVAVTMAETGIVQAVAATHRSEQPADQLAELTPSSLPTAESKTESPLSSEAAATVAAVRGLRSVTRTPEGQLMVGAELFYVPEPKGAQLYVYPAELRGASAAELDGRELKPAEFSARLRELRSTLAGDDAVRASGLAALMQVQPQLFGPAVAPESVPNRVESRPERPTGAEARSVDRESEVAHQAQADIARRARELIQAAQREGQDLIQGTIGASTGVEAQALLAEIRAPLATAQREALATATEHEAATTAADRATAKKLEALGIRLPTERIPAERATVTGLLTRMYGLIGDLTEPIKERRAA